MLKMLKVLGIAFSIITILIAVYSLIVNEPGKDMSAISSWVCMSMSAMFLFRGAYYYLSKKDWSGPVFMAMGMFGLVFALFILR